MPREGPTPMTALRAPEVSSKSSIQRPLTSGTSSTSGSAASEARTGTGTVSKYSRTSSYGVTTTFESSTTADTFSTSTTVWARSTASAGRVGSDEPKLDAAVASIRLVPSSATLRLRSPLAESVRPTAAMIAATPIIGPSSSSAVRILRATRPEKATPTRSRAPLTTSSCR